MIETIWTVISGITLAIIIVLILVVITAGTFLIITPWIKRWIGGLTNSNTPSSPRPKTK